MQPAATRGPDCRELNGNSSNPVSGGKPGDLQARAVKRKTSREEIPHYEEMMNFKNRIERKIAEGDYEAEARSWRHYFPLVKNYEREMAEKCEKEKLIPLQEALTACNEQIDFLTGSLNKKDEQLKKHLADTDNIRMQLNYAITERTQIEQIKKSLEAQNKRLTHDKETLATRLREANAARTSILDQMVQLTQEHEQLKNYHSALKSQSQQESKHLKEQLQGAAKEVEELKRKAAGLETTLTTETNKRHKAEEDLRRYQALFNGLKKDINEFQQR